MSAFTTIDLSRLPAPSVVEALDYEAILATMRADLIASAPDLEAALALESDPLSKLLEVCAYRELLLRQRVNDAAKAVMLAFAVGSDLDQIGASFNVQRLVIDAGDPSAIPPMLPVFEPDADFRARIQLALEGITTAGSEGGYVFHGLSADADVRDIQAVSPNPGEVLVYVLSRTGDGAASAGLLATVTAALNAESVRPLTDHVTVQTATIVPFTIAADLTMYPGPDHEVVRHAAEGAVTAYVEGVRRIGYDVTLSGLYAALHQPGVQNVIITQPAASIVIGQGQAANCTSIAVTAAGVTDV